MSADLLLKLLLGVAIPGVLGAIAMAWRASRDWTRVGVHVDALVNQVRQLVERIDVMSGQLDSVRIWRAAHQATSDAESDRIDAIERAGR
jgi:preprotein translocase subunit Sec63